MAGIVDIVLPSGEAATVPEADLEQALAAGASLPKPEAGPDGGGVAGQIATGVIGAGRTASAGVTDKLIRAGADIIGGDSLRKETMGTLSQAREANPYSNLIGEGAGLFLPGAGQGLTAAGEAAEQAVAGRLGEGLLGKAASMGARGALEGALIGEQQQTTEDALGDHDYNGQAVFASAAENALLGGGAGALLGVGSHYLGEGAGLLARRHGPPSNAVLDDVAGTAGAGRALRQDAREAEDFITKARASGATSDQAAQMVDDASTLAKARANAGIGSGLVDAIADKYASTGNASMAELKAQQYAAASKKVAEQAEQLDTSAKKLADAVTTVTRGTAAVDEMQFQMKPQMVAKLVDRSKLDLQADTAASFLQEFGDMLGFWETTEGKGGVPGAIRKLRGIHTDLSRAISDAALNGGEEASANLAVKLNSAKQLLDKEAMWGMGDYGIPEAVGKKEGLFGGSSKGTIRDIANKVRGTLEDDSVWGAELAGAQREGNAAYSNNLARTNHALDQFGVSIDQQGGRRIPEGDFAKSRKVLEGLRGNEVDEAMQPVKSFRAYISGQRQRIAWAEKYADMSPAQAKAITEAKSALSQAESVFEDSRKNSAVVNRLQAQILNEQGKGMGGLIGLIGDVVSKPLTTMDRLGQVRLTTEKVENAIAGGLRKFFGGSGEQLADRIAPRAKDVVAKEIGDVRELAGNPSALESKTESMVSELRKHAPKIADAAKATAQRALLFLANEAPPASVPLGIVGYHNVKPRYSDQQTSAWEDKRRAALNPQTVVDDMKHGRLNREAIRTVEFVAPKLFAKMQDLAWEQIEALESQGKLDSMPYQQKAAIATLLKVPPDGTWKPDFIAMMQAAKLPPVPAQQGGAGGVQQANQGVSKRRVDINTDIFKTASQGIEAGGIA